MNNRKFMILIIIVLAVSLFTTGCMKKVNEKIGSKIGEKILEKALGDDVKIDTKDNTLSIGTKDGNLQLGESLDWPEDKMDSLPKPNGKIVSVSEQADDQSTTVMVHFPDKNGPVEYLEKIKDLGYVDGSMSESEGFFSYMGYGTDNSQVMVHSQGLDDDLTMAIITLSKDNAYAKEFFSKVEEGELELDLTGIDMTNEVPWPQDQMDKIPELPGKIIDVTSSKDSVYIELEYVKRQDVLDFIEKIKKLGFDASASEVISPDNILYMSLDDKDYGLSVRWFGTGANINYTKP